MTLKKKKKAFKEKKTNPEVIMKQFLASSLLGEETKYIFSFWFNSYKD